MILAKKMNGTWLQHASGSSPAKLSFSFFLSFCKELIGNPICFLLAIARGIPRQRFKLILSKNSQAKKKISEKKLENFPVFPERTVL